MSKINLLRLAKKSKMRCCLCNCKSWTADGRPIFGNNIYSPKILNDGRELCDNCVSKLLNSGEITSDDIFFIPEWSETDRVSDYGEKYDFVSDLESYTVFYSYPVGEHSKRRCQKEEKTVFVYKHGGRTYGRRYSIEDFCNKYDIQVKIKEKEKDKNAIWHKRIARAIKCLESSGLWPDLLAQLKELNQMTYEDKIAIHDLYASEEYSKRFTSPEYEQYEKKYPFLFGIDSSGNKYLKTFYIWEMSEVNLKSMYFGKYQNEHTKELIKEAIANKKKYSACARTSYDVSFEYDPDKNNSAWYSEEYKNTGNGHYYIAIDHNTCWFTEND